MDISLIIELQTFIQNNAKVETKLWWEKYLKNVIEFRGVKMADTRKSVHNWYKSNNIDSDFSPQQQKELACSLIKEEYAEDKLAGIILFHEILIPKGYVDYKKDLNLLGSLFDDGFIYGWNICDWFCVKFLHSLIKAEGRDCAKEVSKWRSSENVWKRRASCVAFVNLAKKGDQNFKGFTEMVLQNCKANIKHEQRFSQTGAGWVLRELSVSEPKRVYDFIKENIKYFSREGLRYSIEKMNSNDKKELLELHSDN